MLLFKIVRPVYLNENTINLQVAPERMVIEPVIEDVDSEDAELTIVDNEDPIVLDDMMDEVEISQNRTPEVKVRLHCLADTGTTIFV